MMPTLERLGLLLDAVKDPVLDDWDPMEFGLLFAKLEYPLLNIEAEKAHFLSLVNEVRGSIPTEASFLVRSEHVIKAFATTLGFDGDKTNYYNIKNSFLNDVLLRRKGIPISLSLVFMALCRELDVKAVGISFPGHFLVRLFPSKAYLESHLTRAESQDWREQRYIDCFDGAKVLSVADCEKRLQDWTRGMVPFGPEVLTIAHPREILSRQLRNLRAILMEKEDLTRLYWVLTALIELCPNERVETFRERGLLLARMERYPSACTDFVKYLSLSQDPAKRVHVENLLRMFEDRGEVCN